MTSFQKYALAVCAGMILAAAMVLSFLIGRSMGARSAGLPGVSVRIDTLTIRDTVRERYPVEVDRWHTKVQLIPVRDTVRIRDTTYVAMEREAREYRSADYRAVVSGIRPSLDEITVFPKTVYLQTQVSQPVADTRRRARVGFGLTAGPGVFWDGTAIRPGLGATAGVTLTF